LKKLLRVTVIGASVVALAACGGQGGAGEMSQNGYRTNQTGAGPGIRGGTDYGTHNNRNLRMNQEMARAIERIDGISRARVVLGESNAYVAVELNENAGNSQALGGSNERSSRNAGEFGMRGNYYGATDSRVFPSVRGQDGTRQGAGTTGLDEAGSGSAATNMYGYNVRGNGRGMNGGSEISGYAGGDGNPGGFLSGLGRMFGMNGGRQGANDANGGANGTTGAGGAAGTAGTGGAAGAGNGLIGGTTMQQTGMQSTSGARTGASSAADLGSGARSYGTNHRMDLNGDMDYGRYRGMNGGTTGTGLSGRIGLNRTGMNGPDDANSRYMHNGGAYGQMSAYNNNNGLSMQVRARVESVVRSLAPNVRNVYVSSDRTFMERLGTYNANSFGGDGGKNLVTQFNQFVGRIFNVDGPNRYDMHNGYDQRNRNGVTQLMDNSFERGNPRHAPGTGGVSGAGTGTNQAQAGTLGSAR